MFQNWSIKKIYVIFGLILIIIALIQLYSFLTFQNEWVHFGLLFVALFIALMLFHSVNIKLKKRKKNK